MSVLTELNNKNYSVKIVSVVVFLLTTAMCLTVLAPVATAHYGDTEMQKSEEIHKNIGEDLSNDGDNVEVLIHFEEYRDVVKINDRIDVDSLKDYSTTTQQPAVDFAERTRGVSVEKKFWLSNMILLRVDTTRTSLENLEKIKGVESLTKNFKFTLDRPRTHSKSDRFPYNSTGQSQLKTQYETTYGIRQINATSVWDEYETQGSKSLVTVLDTGVDSSHPDINLNRWAEFDSGGDRVGSSPFDQGSHGTHVSGTVAGGNNSGSYIGVAPDVVLNHGKVFQDDGTGSFASVISGMQWAVSRGSDVVSMSLGVQGYYDSWIEPVQNAEDSGTLVVASIGNSGEGTSAGPGNVYDATSVGATDSGENVEDFSSGALIDTDTDWNDAPTNWPNEYTVPTVSAPGYWVDSAVPNGGYALKSGTSMAAPHVAGSVALVLSATGNDVQPRVMNRLLESTAYKPNGSTAGERDNRYGSGIIDVYEATKTLENPIEIQSVNSSTKLNPNEDLSFDYTLNNQISRSENESSVNLIIDGVLEDSDSNVTVSPNGQKTRTLTFNDVGSYEPGETIMYTVELEDNSDKMSGQLEVKKFDDFDVSIQNVNTPNEEDEVELEVEVRNTGNIQGNQDISVKTPLGSSVYKNLDLSAGDNRTINLSVKTELGDIGSYPAVVSSEDDSASTNFTVKEAKIFHVEVIDKVDPIEGDKNVNLSVLVTNTKNSTQTQEIETTLLNGDKQNVTLKPNETKTVNLSVPTDVGEAGTYTSEVRSKDDSTTYETEVHIPRVGTSNDYPSDIDSDGLYEDVDGDGQFTIFDIQAFFSNFERPEITDHSHAYDFDGDSDIDMFDIQEHFREL